MYVVVYEPSSGQTILSRRLEAGEVMDHRTFAEHVTRRWGGSIDDRPGHASDCSGDLRVEFREAPGAEAGILSGRSFCLGGVSATAPTASATGRHHG